MVHDFSLDSVNNWSTEVHSITEIANSFGVCESSVRNWIKTGY